ncbi:DNA cytosine methyltransferase [Nonomuraea sp. NPDC049646]|uniref:DNA cytosine methyltransferase n=1 Tax=unclassified Nonomuraea TaxID=2593643 RepID=UPI0037B4DDCC
MDDITVGGLCSGTGILEHTIAEQVGGRVAWHAQHEPADKNGREDKWQFAARILHHHWPHIPNLGDLTTIDWDQVEKVEWVVAGWPCTDVSLAGLGLGIAEGTRSGIWRHVAACIRAQRAMRRPGEPGPYIFLENVRGLLSARADSDLEFCPRCMGDRANQPALRALGRVLGDLANLGFDAEWVGLPASRPDIGACHERWREFILAWPAADTGGPRLEIGPIEPHGSQCETAERGHHQSVADAANDGHERSRDARGRRDGSADGDHPAADTDRDKVREQPVGQSRRSGQAGVRLDRPTASDADGGQLSRHPQRHLRPEDRVETSCGDDAERRVLDWGDYAPAVRRWEEALGRPAPRPTQPGRSGRDQLAPRFSEWMMGLPEGHVTAIPRPEGMSLPGYRNAQLKVIGGGVVPQQAAYAFRVLMQRAQEALDA